MIKLADFNNIQVKNLVEIHLNNMHDTPPLGHSFALDLSALQQADICLYTLWDNDLLLGCGAIQELSPVHGELKSMRTHPDHLRKGVASKILEHLIITAIQRN